MTELVRELRSAALTDADVKGRTIRGFAAVYDTPWSEKCIEQVGYIERVARGAFRKALGRAGNVPLRAVHDFNNHGDIKDILATTRNQSLRLKDEAKGLYFEADIAKTTLGNDVLEQVKRGDVWGVSYGMDSDPTTDSAYTYNPPTRTINTMNRLVDITLTSDPAYEATTVEMRSKGFVALSMQEIFPGAEEQGEEAAREFSSHDASHFDSLFREFELSILERGGGLP